MLKRKAICVAVMFSYTGLLLGCNSGTSNGVQSNALITPDVIKSGVIKAESVSNSVL